MESKDIYVMHLFNPKGPGHIIGVRLVRDKFLEVETENLILLIKIVSNNSDGYHGEELE